MVHAGHPRDHRLPRPGQRRARTVDRAGNGDRDRREPDRRHPRDGARRRPSTSRRCRTSPRRATRGSCSSGPPASPWTASTSAATSRASSPATSRAARSTGNNKWSLDGVDITDMSATGASPIYYDFDMLAGNAGHHRRRRRHAADRRRRHQPRDQERHRPLHAARAATSSPTRSSSRTTSPTSCARRAPARAHPIQNIKDYGFDVGGPIVRRPRLVLGQLRHAGHQGRRRRLLQEHLGLPSRRRRAQPAHDRRPTCCAAVSRPT